MEHDQRTTEEALRQQGLALTTQRRIILQELSERQDHPTAEQVYESVRDRLPGLSKATVYRVLDTLVHAGAARKVFHPGAIVRYDPMTIRHHHLICQGCGKLVDIDPSMIEDIRLASVTVSGFQVTDYTINFTGICSKCQESSSKKIKGED
jgi:Fur family peroxide stress response transcriptional regulator